MEVDDSAGTEAQNRKSTAPPTSSVGWDESETEPETNETEEEREARELREKQVRTVLIVLVGERFCWCRAVTDWEIVGL